ncbi:hypothetical protein UFOVP1533_37 [uncultured Caudovirales phage]|uniref:Uncharacterized protein n=1 Tax=uncultured Caudovirales phage TaxID=2100421 RepID=A0A6J5QE49_9CAUD|nr:hypothetical protein UFOVP1086_37 [uncultured Caudovirales phage]CAB4212847.1 hypothetical protein UFOVP1440_37 [uncultured Caudovirales phage]CAB5228315.1 hypothetical protein UFOVP1533_37 [uncultured Caudovirales phage]
MTFLLTALAENIRQITEVATLVKVATHMELSYEPKVVTIFLPMDVAGNIQNQTFVAIATQRELT